MIGAGIQSLLHILCPLLEQRQTVSFPNPSFVQGSTVFHDYGFQIDYRNKDCDIIYVSPAHMTKWGDIMPVSRRLELVNYSASHGSLVIEDDFENEFVYLQKPTPSLFGLAGGQNVVYLGTFSRLLLPPSVSALWFCLRSFLHCTEKRQTNIIRQHQKQSRLLFASLSGMVTWLHRPVS